MKRFFVVALLLSSVALAGTVRTRAWCKHPKHGGGYAWISDIFEASSSDPCWKVANEHKQQNDGHQTGCSYVNEQGERR